MKNRYGLLLAMLFMAVSFGQLSQAQAKENIDTKQLPSLLGGSNAGTEFWFSFPTCYPEQGGTNAIKIYVSAGTAVQCTVEVPGLGVRYVKTTKPNDIIDFTMYPGEAQPYESMANPSDARPESQTYAEGKGRGVHVTAPVPIIVYGVSRYVYTSDSFLAIPTSALGKEYIVASYADLTAGAFSSLHLPSQTIVVAAYDNTIVSFTLGGPQGTQTVGGMKFGETRNFTLNKGDLVAFASKKMNGIYADLSGSKFKATKPIAVVSGNQCAYVDVTTPACDFIMEMELPTTTWGKEYHVTRFRNRKNYSYMKIFAKNPNTKLYRDGNPIPFAVLSTAGGRPGAGYYQGRILDDGLAPRPIVIRGDGPISVTTYNPGQSDDGVTSDPFQLILTPQEQFQKEIIFCTPGIKGGQGFKQNYVNLVFEGNPDGSMPDDLEFATVENSEFSWKAVKSIFGATSEPFKGFPGDTKKYYAKIITLPGDGVYKIRAQKPFAAYAYGFDNYDSYGHPTSVALGDLSKNDPDNPEFSFTQQCDGSVLDGKVEDLPKIETPTKDRSNLAMVTLLDGSKNYILKVQDFIPGDAVNTTWSLKVEDPTQDAIANVYFSDRAGNDTTVTITYLAPAVKFDATSINYGLLKTNNPKVMQLVVRNTSTVAPQIITDIKIKGEGTSGFTFVTPPALPITIQPEKTESFPIQFVSAVEGNDFKDSVIVEINGCTKIGAELLASVGEPVIEVTDIAFGVMPAGKLDTRSLTVKNTGKVDLILSGVSGNKLTEFTQSGNGWNITPTSTITLKPGESQDLQVSFKSNVVGNYVDTIFFANNATRIKNYSVLTAGTITGDLGAVGFTWPRKRINKSYNDGFIVLTNFGDLPVTITSSKIIGADGSNFSMPVYGNVTIQGKSSGKNTDTIRLVTFTPSRTGNFTAQVEFTTTENAVVTADLKGIGIVPRITMEPLKDFGQTAVGGAAKNTRTVVITNEDYEWADSVTITDFTSNPVNGISWLSGIYSGEGFSFDKATFLGSGLVIQPGKTATISADFIAQKAGASSAEIRPVSDAENNSEVVSVWKGIGLTAGIVPTSTTGTFCINQNGTITVTIRNPNNTDAVVTGMDVTNVSIGATFTEVNPGGFTVPANDGTNDGIHTVTYTVSSSVVGTNTATILITSSASPNPQPIDVSFTTVDYTRTASMSRGLKVDVGSQIGASIKLENGADFSLAEVHKLDIAFNYNPTLVQIDKATIATSVPGFEIKNLDVKPTAGTVTLSLESTSPTNSLPRTGELELVSWKFDAFLNGQPIDSMEINQTVTVADNSCLKIQSKPGFLTVNPVCGGDVRRINVSGITYSMSVSPNPVVSGEPTEITFSVGLESYTTIEVTNAMGVVVATLVNQTLTPDSYIVTLDTQNLSSGMYFYRIVSGPYTETKKMLISK